MTNRETVTGRAPVNPDDAPVPNSETHPDGQHVDHWVMTAAERARGFVRPVRDSYRHVGARPVHPTRDLTDDEKARYGSVGYVCFEMYPEGGSCTGRFWTQAQLSSGCGGSKTSMPQAIAETYAANPGYYGSTFCCKCGGYFPVGLRGEFVWDGTNEKVGS